VPLAAIARVVSWIAALLVVFPGAALLLRDGATTAERWLGLALVSLGLMAGLLLWMVTDLWEARRLGELAEVAERRRRADALSGWPDDPSARA
jgi:uncharacterized membrane protein YqaE (UPF0057 family)